MGIYYSYYKIRHYKIRSVYFSFIGWMKKNYEDSKRKNVNLKGKWCKNGGKRGNFHCTWGKKNHFEKKGGGQNDHILGKYTPLYKIGLYRISGWLDIRLNC